MFFIYFQTNVRAFNVKSQNEDNIIWGLAVYYFTRNGNQCRRLPHIISAVITAILKQNASCTD